MRFASEFVEEVKQRKSELSSMFSKTYKNEFEKELGLMLEQRWLPLPHGENLESKEYAVDGSMAHRSLVNGVDLFFARALLIGHNGIMERKKFTFEALRALENADEVRRFLRLLMNYLEVQIILENIDKLANSVVLMDGSLYGRFTHYYREVMVSGFEDFPLKLISSLQELFIQCKQKEILLIGVSKYSRSRALSRALMQNLVSKLPSDLVPSDMEIIYRWKMETPGYSMPLILGDYAVYWEIDKLSENPSSFLERSFPSIHESMKVWGQQVLSNISRSPAIAMCYVLPEVGDAPLRLDVPVNLLDDTREIGTVSPFEFADPLLLEKVISYFLGSRGGREVYNALLYIVDKEVRMSARVVDSLYKSIICEELGFPVEYERGMRRFFE